MVKLGNNFTEKNNVKVVSEDGFDTIPLITPLDASQLQFPPPDKVVVKTKADYDAESKKGKLRSPKIAEFSISIIEGVSERLKVRQQTVAFLPGQRQTSLHYPYAFYLFPG
uniref:Neuronal vesicle trafficking-associated protein 1 n=1 Tax=Oryzias melastigma TaxID=30732 RepID=A0A3B3BLG8_ORYME